MKVTFNLTPEQLEVIKELLSIIDSKTYKERYLSTHLLTYCSCNEFTVWWSSKDISSVLREIANHFLTETDWQEFFEVGFGYLFRGKGSLYHQVNGCSNQEWAFRVRLHFLEHLEQTVANHENSI